jgi:hypothetical protein
MLLSIAALGIATLAPAVHAQSALPLMQSSDFTYLGGFALPSWANGAYGTSNFEYGGHGLMYFQDPATGKGTLYMEGHAQHPGAVAQVEVPSSFVKSEDWNALPIAKLLQPFADLPSAPDPASCTGNPSFIYGMLAYNGRLLLGAACSYGGSQTTSHAVRALDLSMGGTQGYYGFAGAVAPPRALGGPMINIPKEWQSAFGGPAMTGNCCISVTGSTSAGPSLTVFNPDDVGNKNPIPGTTVLFYPLSNPACGLLHCEATQSSVYNLTTVYGGGAFPSGTRSVLFVTAHGTGSYCYGSASDCGDPILLDVKGPHAPPYRYQVLAYDANDLIAVKEGRKAAWDPKPYAVFELTGMPNSSNNRIKGAAYDQAGGRLFIAQDYGAQPRIEVYQLKVAIGSAPTPVIAPVPPSSLIVR